MKLVLATHNQGKVAELRAILEPVGMELVGYDGPEPVEDGTSFLENAFIKARAAHKHTGLPAIADDSGLQVEILGGSPGIFTAIWSGTKDNVALRLGHGVRIIEDIFLDDANNYGFGEVATWVLERGIALELSPSSNLQTGAIPGVDNPEMKDHPFDDLYRLGFNVTVNTDNRLMSGTTITRELELLVDAFEYDLEDLELFQLNAANAAFIDMDIRSEIIERITEGFANA